MPAPQETARDGHRRLGWLPLVLFFSGASALVYEVVWTRWLTTIIGSTAVAVAVVLVGFMGGLALGGALAARTMDARRDRALFFYAGIEFIVGLYAMLSPLLFFGVQAFYVFLYPAMEAHLPWLTGFRLLLALAVLLAPAIGMGATLPLMAAYALPQTQRPGRALGWLYGANTLGGAAGVLAAGFWLMPRFGLLTTLYSAALLNGLLAILVMTGLWAGWWPRFTPVLGALLSTPDEEAPVSRTWITVSAVVSGFCALAAEVLWFRSLHLAFGYAVYTFSAILAAYLIGIGLGGLSAGIWKPRFTTSRQLAYLQLVLAAVGAGLIPVLGYLPLLFPILYQHGYRDFISFQFVLLVVSLGILFVPTLMMGASFTLLSRLQVSASHRAAGGVGSVYAANTLGAIAGTLAATFLFIPQWGTQASLVGIAVMTLLLGLGWLFMVPPLPAGRMEWIWAAVAAGCVVTGALLPSWDRLVQTSGLYTPNLVSMAKMAGPKLQQRLADLEMIFYREGVSATVTVRQSRSTQDLSLQVNGKTDASTGKDLKTQLMVGYLPVLWQPTADHVLVIGLGSGMTLGAALEFKQARIDCVEIEPAIIDAARLFHEFNHESLSDPRVRLITGDGRNHLQASAQEYDVIISQPSNPWISGESQLFTLEFYRAAYQRLVPGGMMVQWFHYYAMSDDDFRVALRTFRMAFPQAQLWWIPQSGDVILLASKDQPLVYDYRVLRDRLDQRPRLRQDLEMAGIETLGDLFSLFALDAEGLQRFAGQGPLNTDRHPRLEFSAPRFIYASDWLERNETRLRQNATPLLLQLTHFQAEPGLKRQLYQELAETYARWKNHDALAIIARRLRGEFPGEPMGYYYLALCEAENDHLPEAELYLKQALTLSTQGFGKANDQNTTTIKAERRRSLLEMKRRPTAWEPYYHLALTYAWERNYPQALNFLTGAIRRGAKKPDLFYYRGLVYCFLDDMQLARADLTTALQLNPGYLPAKGLLGMLNREEKNQDPGGPALPGSGGGQP